MNRVKTIKDWRIAIVVLFLLSALAIIIFRANADVNDGGLSGYALSGNQATTSVHNKLKKKAPDLADAVVYKADVLGLYVVIDDGKIAYTDSDANFLISGPIFNLNTKVDITRVQKNSILARAQIEESQALKPVPNIMATATPAASQNFHDTFVQDEAKTPTSKLKVTSDLPEKDSWGSSSYVPENYIGPEASVSIEAKNGLESMVDRYPQLITTGRITPDGMIRAQLANTMPLDRYAAIYRPEGKAVDHVTIFADPTCPKCLELHEEIQTLLNNGIEVRYVLFPRDFEDEGMRSKLNALYCSAPESRMQFADALFANVEYPVQDNCNSNVVADVIDSLEFFDIKGTPTIFHGNSGFVVPGRVEASFIVELSKQGLKANSDGLAVK